MRYFAIVSHGGPCHSWSLRIEGTGPAEIDLARPLTGPPRTSRDRTASTVRLHSVGPTFAAHSDHRGLHPDRWRKPPAARGGCPRDGHRDDNCITADHRRADRRLCRIGSTRHLGARAHCDRRADAASGPTALIRKRGIGRHDRSVQRDCRRLIERPEPACRRQAQAFKLAEPVPRPYSSPKPRHSARRSVNVEVRAGNATYILLRRDEGGTNGSVERKEIASVAYRLYSHACNPISYGMSSVQLTVLRTAMRIGFSNAHRMQC